MPDKIEKEKVLLVEGKDEINFFKALLKHISINDVQIIEVGGKDRFKDEFPAFLRSPGFYSVKIYAIIRDADVNAKAVLQSIQSLFKKYNQPIPARTGFAQDKARQAGIYILPGNRNEGMLENICLETVAETPVLECVEEYIKCLDDKLERKKDRQKSMNMFYFPRNLAKAKAHTFLAGMYDSVPSIGIAALKGYWDFDHPSLNKLKEFLSKFKKDI